MTLIHLQTKWILVDEHVARFSSVLVIVRVVNYTTFSDYSNWMVHMFQSISDISVWFWIIKQLAGQVH